MANRKRKRTEAPTGGDGDLKSKPEIHDCNRKRKRDEPPTGGGGDLNSKPASRKPRKSRAKPKQTSDEMIASVLGDNPIEDVQWLCSLSESELDMLTFLKMMVLRRANENHPGFGDKIDLKVLRDLSLTMMKKLKEELKKDHLAPSCDCKSVETWKQVDQSKLSQVHVEEKFSSMTKEELWPFIRPNIPRRLSRQSQSHSIYGMSCDNTLDNDH